MVTLVQPLGRLVLLEVFAEAHSGGLVIIEDDHRSLQGQVVALGPDALGRDVVVGDEVMFDDNDCTWWRGSVPSYLSAVLDDPAEPEYVLVPIEQITAVLDREEVANHGTETRQDRHDRPEQAGPSAAEVQARGAPPATGGP